MKIGIIIGSTRPGRKGEAVGQWVHELASAREDAQFELIDLADFDLPLLAEAALPGEARRSYESPRTRAWGQTIDQFDGYVWVTPEYNHGVPAAMKNALDVLYPEWRHKAVAFVAYGFDGGVRSVEQWRTIVAAVFMVGVRSQVSLTTYTDWRDGEFAPQERRSAELGRVLDQLVQMTGSLQRLRAE